MTTAYGQPHRTLQPDDVELKRMVVEGEGRVPYMYLDSEAKGT